jgi:menaquinone-dependent protoporphyrinogen oxidase
MSRTLILYSTTDGQTLRICRRVEAIMTALGQQVMVLPVAEAEAQLGSGGIAPFERVVIGASIRYGKHQPAVFDFVGRHAVELNSKPSAFFTVNVVARKPAKNAPDTNPYMKKFLRQVPWKPAALGVFAGKIDYPKYSWRDRQVIRFIMWMTHGPTAPDSVVEFTDWNRVDAFAREAAALGG